MWLQGQHPHEPGAMSHSPQERQAGQVWEWEPASTKSQIISQFRGDEAGPISSQEVNPQVKIRSSKANQG